MKSTEIGISIRNAKERSKSKNEQGNTNENLCPSYFILQYVYLFILLRFYMIRKYCYIDYERKIKKKYGVYFVKSARSVGGDIVYFSLIFENQII